MAIYQRINLDVKNTKNEKFTDAISVDLWVELFSRNLLNRFTPAADNEVASLKKVITSFVENYQRMANRRVVN